MSGPVLEELNGPPCQSKHMRGGVVLERRTRRVEDHLREVLDRFARVLVAVGGDHRRDVDVLRVALQHAVGEEHQPVTRLQRQRLHLVLVATDDPERRVGLEDELLDASGAQPQRRRMPGVDDRRGLLAQVHASDLPGDEAAVPGELTQPVVGQPGLLGEPDARPARVAQRPDEHGRQHRGVDLVAHRVGHRQVQGLAFQGEVERVAPDIARRLQPRRERELTGLARVGAGQQAMLDLRRERERDGPLAPREQVGEAAVGDDHVRERVRGERDVRDRLLVDGSGERDVEHTDRLPAVAHGREHPIAGLGRLDLDRLGGERATVRSTRSTGRSRRSRDLACGRPPLRARDRAGSALAR